MKCPMTLSAKSSETTHGDGHSVWLIDGTVAPRFNLCSPRCAGSGFRAAHRAAVKGTSSRPCRASIPRANSLTAVGGFSVQAGCAAVFEGGPSRGRGSRALMSVARSRPTVPLDELARCSRTALRSTALPFASFAAHEPDRLPGHPPCPQPGRPNAMCARIGSTAAPVAAVRQLGGTSAAGPPVLVNVCGPLAAAVAPAELSRRPHWLGPFDDAVAARCAG